MARYDTIEYGRFRQRRLLAPALALLLGVVGSAAGGTLPPPLPGAPPPACRYEVTVIEGGPLCGGSPVSTQAKAINENGDVAGDAFCFVNRTPFMLTAEAGFQVLPNPPGSSDSPVAAMNNLREIVGTAEVPEFRCYFRNAAGQYSILPVGPNGTEGWGNGLDDASIVVGQWGNGVTGPNPLPCKWIDGRLIDLIDLFDAPKGAAHAINSIGQITGWTGTAQSGPAMDARAFVLDGAKLTVLPPIPSGVTSEGRAINDRGDVAGMGRFATTPTSWHAYLYADGEAFDLGTLLGSTKAIANDINNYRVVVGGAPTHGFVWQDGAMRDLNDLIPSQPRYTLKTAYSINDEGVIALWGSLGGPSGPSRGFILTPVYPPPADLDGSCSVNGLDLGILLSNWSIPPSAAGCHGDSACPADLNGDRLVNGLDLGILLANWSMS